ncbi:hypothetical protein M422DRAFT_37359 [Sphaerobolus stellatus SS14]|uniref:Uncharacterized protein n=1 Tax=Sphaerobolus stellatus (strain SS14) TaxID=990650 RepID=A0A0C9TG28_SPHS4|nr:hypothetical protein M422DRAFT_37359 [Sphaerobolus stellatus SS14]
MPATPTPSSPSLSDSSLLAFTYEDISRDIEGVDYPYPHDIALSPNGASEASASFPPTQLGLGLPKESSPSRTPRPIDHVRDDEERQLGHLNLSSGHAGYSNHYDKREPVMDPFSKTELAVMTGSSLAVGGLITVSVFLTLGRLVL